MSGHQSRACEFIESRWWKFSEDPPRSGQVFADRKNKGLFPQLFTKTSRDLRYCNDQNTVIWNPCDMFSHWLPVAECQGDIP